MSHQQQSNFHSNLLILWGFFAIFITYGHFFPLFWSKWFLYLFLICSWMHATLKVNASVCRLVGFLVYPILLLGLKLERKSKEEEEAECQWKSMGEGWGLGFQEGSELKASEEGLYITRPIAISRSERWQGRFWILKFRSCIVITMTFNFL